MTSHKNTAPVPSQKEQKEKTVSSENDQNQKESHNKKNDFLSSMGEKFGEESKIFRSKLSHLPVHKKLIFFTGLTLIVLALLNFVGYASLSGVFLLLIGGFMGYVALSDKNPLTQYLEDKSQK